MSHDHLDKHKSIVMRSFAQSPRHCSSLCVIPVMAIGAAIGMPGRAGGSWLRSVFPPDGPPGLVADTGAMADRGCREQHKCNTSPGIGEDQHAGNTNKTAFRGTRRHDR
jgi:hypothetical protein